METVDVVLMGLQVALSLENLFVCFLGVLLGTLIGVLPGIGPTATIAMLLPLSIALPPVAALIMMAGIYYGAQYGGSTTAILVNLPGEAASAVTAIDGYQMARNGRAGAALSVAAIGSFVAGTIGTLIIVLFAKPLSGVAIMFGSAEYFSLVVLGLVCAVALAHGSIVKSMAMLVLGLGFGLVGTDINAGVQRMTLGTLELADGLDIVALAVGLFGVAEILRNLEGGSLGGAKSVIEVKSLMPTRQEMRASAAPILRGSALGSLLGVLPGGGALLSSFASYALERKLAKDPGRFGKGAIEGVAGPESANNAAAQTSFIPMLTLGIPSNAAMAMMAGAMIMQGIVPGPDVVTSNPELFWGLVASMWIGNAMLVILNLPLVGLWVKLLQIPYIVLFPAIIIFSVIGVYSTSANPFHLYTLAFFGVLGYVLIRRGCEPTPLLLGFLLGPMLESHLQRAMVISRGDPMVFLTSPISAVLLLCAAAVLVASIVPSISRKRDEIFVEED